MLILIKEEDESINDGCLLISRRLDLDERPGECGLGSDANTTERNVGVEIAWLHAQLQAILSSMSM